MEQIDKIDLYLEPRGIKHHDGSFIVWALYKMLMVVTKYYENSFVPMEYGNSCQTYANMLLQCVQVFHKVDKIVPFNQKVEW